MKKALIVVDYQNDFVDGSLGFLAAENIADKIYTLVAKAMSKKDFIVFTICQYEYRTFNATQEFFNNYSS